MSWKKSMLFATLACAALAAVYAAAAGAQQAAPFDTIVRGGHIVDGTGNPWVAGDVGIRNGRIAAVGSLASAQAARVIDAAGRIVAPGFIDLHTHSDVSVLADPLDVLGESTSVAPRDGLKEETASDSGGVKQDWTTFTDYFKRVESRGVSMNLISHVSAEQVRRVVMGYDARPATAAELDRMKK